MHRKQIVINRKYFVPNNLTHPSSPSSSVGGFNNLSIFGGSSRPLNSAAALIIAFTSLTLPLHKSHRGDSGITNLFFIQYTKPLVWMFSRNFNFYFRIQITTKNIKICPVHQWLIANFYDLELSKRFPKLSCRTQVMETDCTFQQLRLYDR